MIARKACIVVAGMYRSGTSAVTRVVNLLGADIARNLLPALPGDNDRGFWEATAVVEIHDRLLHALGSSYHDPLPLPDRWRETSAARLAKRQLADELQRDFADSALFVVKDPRIARLLPLWLDLLDELALESIVVIPIRDPVEIAASLAKREGFPAAQSSIMYLRSYLETELASRSRRRLFVRYDLLLADWRPFAERLRKLVGPLLPPPTADHSVDIGNFLTIDLYRNRSGREEHARDAVATAAAELFDRMSEAAERDSDAELQEFSARLGRMLAEPTPLLEGLVTAERAWHRNELATARGRMAELEGTLAQLTNWLKEANADRTACHEQINSLTSWLKEANADRAACHDQINALTNWLKEANADRAECRNQINMLTSWLNEANADRAACHQKIDALTSLSKEP